MCWVRCNKILESSNRILKYLCLTMSSQILTIPHRTYSSLYLLAISVSSASCIGDTSDFQWNSASTLPYLKPSTFNSKASPALSTTISNVKSRLSNSTPLVVVNRVKRLLGTAPRSVVSVHTLMRSRVYEAGGSPSASEAMRSSETICSLH